MNRALTKTELIIDLQMRLCKMLCEAYTREELELLEKAVDEFEEEQPRSLLKEQFMQYVNATYGGVPMRDLYPLKDLMA